MGERAVEEGESPTSVAGGRYRVVDVLGRGGMAIVYRVTDTQSGRTLALKRLSDTADAESSREIELAFQREYHTLCQLAHPQLIEVYDYGVEDGRPFYTMELLDGGDLRSRSPMPWREACAALVDVCSSLSLLHSRRLVHRDISPRNIHCSADGRAKLIDFGALIPVGSGGQVVGTPPYVAPEVVYRLSLDGRTDLFSLGATLYYALTRKHAYPAREFRQLPDAWRNKPRSPSAVDPEVPPALDALVMSLIDVDPAARPSSAFEVMQRLIGVAGLEHVESEQVAGAYLFAPTLVGREGAVQTIVAQLERIKGGRGGGVWIGPGGGLGRTRMLDECVLHGKGLGATVVRADADAEGSAPLSVVRRLAAQLDETAPETGRAARPSHPPPALATSESADFERACQAVVEAFLDAAARAPVLIAVDNVQRIDDASAAVLANLAELTEYTRLFLAVTHDGPATGGERLSPTLALIAARTAPVELWPLDPPQTRELLASVFGDVPNVSWLSQRLHGAAGGHPRALMDLLGHLCDSGLVSYSEGRWVLPASLEAEALPVDAEQAFVGRLQRLPPLARRLVEAQALASHQALTRRDYQLLAPDSPPQAIDGALDDLLAHGVLDGNEWVYSLSRANYARAVTASLDSAGLRDRHAAVARLYEATDPKGLPVIYHLLEAEQNAEALDKLVEYGASFQARGLSPVSQTSSATLVGLIEKAVDVGIATGLPGRPLQELRRAMLLLSVTSSTHLYYRARPEFLAQVVVDSGLAAYRELDPDLEPSVRLQRALETALARHAALPEEERVWPVDEAIQALVQYVAVSIAVAARTMDAELMHSLPALLEPFTSLSPLVHAMWQNAIASFEMSFSGRAERAMTRSVELYERLAGFSEEELPYVSLIRNAIAYGAGSTEAYLGRPSASRWADVLDRDPLQRINVAHLRKLICLQAGDAKGAERHRVKAERLAAQASHLQMFSRPYRTELQAYHNAGDLTRVRELVDGLTELSERCAGWLPMRWLAEGHFHRMRGDYGAALDRYGRCAAACVPRPAAPARLVAPWPVAMAGIVAALLERGDHAAAHARAEHALIQGRAAGFDTALWDLERVLGLALAALGRFDAAVRLLDDLAARQTDLSVAGLRLGVTYEARTRVAIWQADGDAVAHFARQTAREYRHGHGAALGGSYQRLMLEARAAGMAPLPELASLRDDDGLHDSSTLKTKVGGSR